MQPTPTISHARHASLCCADTWLRQQFPAKFTQDYPLTQTSQHYLCGLNVRVTSQAQQHWATNMYAITDLLYNAAVQTIADQQGITRQKGERFLRSLAQSFGAQSALLPPASPVASDQTPLHVALASLAECQPQHALAIREILQEWHTHTNHYLQQYCEQIPAQAVDLLTDLARVCESAEHQIMPLARMLSNNAVARITIGTILTNEFGIADHPVLHDLLATYAHYKHAKQDDAADATWVSVIQAVDEIDAMRGFEARDDGHVSPPIDQPDLRLRVDKAIWNMKKADDQRKAGDHGKTGDSGIYI